MTDGRIYWANRYITQNTVWVDSRHLSPAPSLALRNHSPTGFEWGYAGSGPAQLALAILLDVTGDEKLSEGLHQLFKRDFIQRLPRRGFNIREREVRSWLLAIQGKT